MGDKMATIEVQYLTEYLEFASAEHTHAHIGMGDSCQAFTTIAQLLYVPQYSI